VRRYVPNPGLPALAFNIASIEGTRSNQGLPLAPECSIEWATGHVNRLVSVAGVTMVSLTGQRVLVDSTGNAGPLVPAPSGREPMVAYAPGSWLWADEHARERVRHAIYVLDDGGKSGNTKGSGGSHIRSEWP
jgi:hypothetical protein